jgi:hypothetical protein
VGGVSPFASYRQPLHTAWYKLVASLLFDVSDSTGGIGAMNKERSRNFNVSKLIHYSVNSLHSQRRILLVPYLAAFWDHRSTLYHLFPLTEGLQDVIFSYG